MTTRPTSLHLAIATGLAAAATFLFAGAQPDSLLRADGPADAARVRADVARLAGDEWQGRRAGTPGSDAASAWIAEGFRRIGLAPAGDAGTYFQGFTFIDGVVLGPANRLAAGDRSWRLGEDFRPLAFSSPGTVSADVVFAGYGIVAKDLGYDDYEGVEVKDRVALVLRYGPGGNDPHSKWAAFTPLRLKAATARDRGAKALLVVTGPMSPDVKDELVPLRADASLADEGLPCMSLRRAVAEALFAGAGTTLEAAQKRIDEASRPAPLALGDAPVELTVDVTPKRASTRNVVGVLRGSGTEAVIVGAHYDHLGLGPFGSLDPAPEGKLHHGADDNASGVAGLLELARRLAPRRDALERSVVFAAFGAEELGALGSSYLVKNPPLPLASVAAMVNMDMIGRLREGALDVHGVGTSPVWKPLLEEANRGPKLTLRLREGGYGPSDHSPFYAAGKPVFFVFTGVHADYHRPSDTADAVNADGIARVLDLVEPVVAALATSGTAVAFTRVAAEKEIAAGPTRGFRVWVGGVPDYSEEGTGVKFSGVSPASPAEKAGLQAGDVLVRFGAKEIRNIYDYTYALGEHKPGDVVTAVVKRAGAEVKLEITLGSRPSAGR